MKAKTKKIAVNAIDRMFQTGEKKEALYLQNHFCESYS